MFGIIKIKTKEYREGCLGVRTYKVTFFGIPVFVANHTSTNNQVIKQLTSLDDNKTTVTGF